MNRLLLVALLAWPAVGWTGEAQPLAADPVVEARLKRLAIELRCLVCQNQTLADSNAPLAEDLRREVRDMIGRNMSDEEIMEFLVQRYGDFVLYRPPWKATTILLWLGPFLLLGIATLTFVAALRRRRRSTPAASMTDEERRRVEELLSGGEHS